MSFKPWAIPSTYALPIALALGAIARLTFVGEAAEQPIISELLKTQNVTVNILEGKVTQTQSGAYGTLTIQIIGSEEDIYSAVQFLNDRQVGVEVIVNA